MKKINLLGYLSMALMLLFISCDQQGEMEILESSNSSIQIDKSKQIILQPTTLTKSEISEASCGESKVVTLTAGQHIDVGTVTVSNDETNLYVIYETTGNWVINETHLYVGPEAGIPLNGAGNPRIGHFPYHGTDDTPFTIPLADLGDDFVIVAHAVVDKVMDGQTVQSETAFGCGEYSFPGNRWGCYFGYDKQDCEEEDCMIVFGKKDIAEYTSCIIYDIDGSDYWGWSSRIPYKWLVDNPENSFHMTIYSNTDGCDFTNGTVIGYVYISLADNGQDLKLNYNINPWNEFELYSINLYSGSEENPYNNDGTLKDTLTDDNFYKVEFDSPVKNSNSIIMPWTGDSSSMIYIIPSAKICPSE